MRPGNLSAEKMINGAGTKIASPAIARVPEPTKKKGQRSAKTLPLSNSLASRTASVQSPDQHQSDEHKKSVDHFAFEATKKIHTVRTRRFVIPNTLPLW